MRRVPITFREKVEARYVRKGRGPCWIWEGSVSHGRPMLNLRHVTRHIYAWERGPVPPGHTLWRTDHRFPECRDLAFECRHRVCVNPWHLEPRPRRDGLYMRENSSDPTQTDHILRYLHTQRGEPRRKEEHDHDGDSQGDDAARSGGRDQGHGVATPGLG